MAANLGVSLALNSKGCVFFFFEFIVQKTRNRKFWKKGTETFENQQFNSLYWKHVPRVKNINFSVCLFYEFGALSRLSSANTFPNGKIFTFLWKIVFFQNWKLWKHRKCHFKFNNEDEEAVNRMINHVPLEFQFAWRQTLEEESRIALKCVEHDSFWHLFGMFRTESSSNRCWVGQYSFLLFQLSFLIDNPKVCQLERLWANRMVLVVVSGRIHERFNALPWRLCMPV